MQNFELLEGRGLLSAVSLSGAVYANFDIEANNTLDTAQDLGGLTTDDIAVIDGLIGSGTGLSSDADWYQFTLSEPAAVQLDVAATSSDEDAAALITLYSGESELYESHNPLRHDCLGQEDSRLEITLGAGTYFMAVTGSGNRYFHPFLADSGLPGEASAYEVTVAVTSLDEAGSVGAQVLGTNVGEMLDSAPSTIQLRFDRSLDESLIADGDTVQLFATTNPDDGEQLQSVGYWSFSHNLNELTLIPQTALQAGQYRLVVSSRLLAPGEDAPDFELDFEVVGQEGCSPSDSGDDTVDTAMDLGELTSLSTVQVAGAIGDDPAYDAYSPDMTLLNRASDVDLYHFSITGDGQWSFIAEAFAGRFGSALDPSLSLYRQLDDCSVELVHFNGNTQNPSEASNGTLPLFTDSVLYAGLTAGEYFVAISSATNDPEYGPDGVFDPTLTHSGLNGAFTGQYVLNVSLTEDDEAPSITGSSIVEGSTLTELPQSFTVNFSEIVNLQQTAAEAFLYPSDAGERAVFITNEDGSLVYPRFDSYEFATQTATFQLLDGLTNGAHELHLRAGSELTDLAGNPLAANDASGDYVIRFNVSAAERGINGNAQQRATEAGHDSVEQAQDLGVFFPRELQSVVQMERDAATSGPNGDTDDYFRFEVIQSQLYFIAVRPDDVHGDLPRSVELLDAHGDRVNFINPGELVGQGALLPGQYILHVGGWTTDESHTLNYHIEFALSGNSENPTPLTSGASSAIGIRLNQAANVGMSCTPTTFVRPIVEAPRFMPTMQTANSSLIQTPTSTSSSAGAIAALPRGLNQGFISKPLGADPTQQIERPDGPSETMLVKLWDKPEANKLFALLDDELPLVNRAKSDSANTEELPVEDLPEPEATSEATTPTNEAAAVEATNTTELETAPEQTPTTLDRVLKQVNQSLQAIPDRAAEPKTQARLDDLETVNTEPVLAGLHAPIGMALALATVFALKDEKKQR